MRRWQSSVFKLIILRTTGQEMMGESTKGLHNTSRVQTAIDDSISTRWISINTLLLCKASVKSEAMYTRTVWSSDSSGRPAEVGGDGVAGGQRSAASEGRAGTHGNHHRQTDRRGLRLHNYATKLRLSVKTNVSVAPRLLFLPWANRLWTGSAAAAASSLFFYSDYQ